jgi:hypothetical protein
MWNRRKPKAEEDKVYLLSLKPQKLRILKGPATSSRD